jgi:diaminopimelate epimerase
MRALSLVKTHAYGNDFLLAPGVPIADAGRLAGLAREVCDRHHGLGADGLVLVDPTPAGARTRLLNADGSPAEVSGNGVRCVAAWLALERSASSGATLEIDTAAGVKTLTVLGRDEARVTFRADMGAPVGVREADLEVAGQSVRAVLLSMGNPQCVVLGPATPERLHDLAGPLAVHPLTSSSRRLKPPTASGSSSGNVASGRLLRQAPGPVPRPSLRRRSAAPTGRST